MKVVVTGGAGYVGSVLVPKLVGTGHEVVLVLDRMLFTDMGLRNVKENPAVKIVEGDIRDENTVRSVLTGADAVIHLASISNDPSSDLIPELTEQTNYGATLLLSRVSKEVGVKRFIYASTSSVYGIKETPNVTEDMSLEPLTVYSRTKAESEPHVLALNDDAFTAVILRPATVCGYSPKMRLDLTVNILTMHALTKGKITVFGGEQKRPNIHIDDITDCYVQMLTAPKDKIGGQIFNVGFENHTVMQIAEMVRDAIGPSIQIEVTPTNDNRSYHISSEKIKNVLGYVPKKTLRDAILDIKQAAEKNLIDWNDVNYYNVKKTKLLLEQGTLK